MDSKFTYQSTRQFIGYTDLTISMIFLSVSLILCKSLVSVFSIFLLLGIKFLISVIIFFLVPVTRKSFFNNQIPLSLKDKLLLCGQGASSAFFNIFLLYGLKTSTATASGLLTSTTPAMTMLLSCLFLGERITLLTVVAIVMAVLGVAAINTHGDIGLLQWNFGGNTLIMMAVICGSLFAIFSKRLPAHITPLKMTVTCNLIVLIIFIPFFILDWSNFSWNMNVSNWVLAIVYALTASICFPLFWNRGQYRTSASTASLFTGIMPICTALLAASFLGEHIYVIDAVGALCILFSLLLGTWKERSIYERRFNFSALLGRRAR